jgi:WD40 repeat protein
MQSNKTRQEVLSVAVHPRLPLIAFGTSVSGSIKVWDMRRGQYVATTSRTGDVVDLQFASDGAFLASAHRASANLVPAITADE